MTYTSRWNWNLISHTLMAVVVVLGAIQIVVTDQVFSVDILIPVALGIAVANARAWWVWLVPMMIGIGIACFDWTKDELGVVSHELLMKDRLMVLISLVSTVGAAVAVGLIIRVNRRLHQVRRDALEAEHEQNLRAAVLGERSRISAEMHDVVGHGLALIAVASEAARYLAQAPADEVDLGTGERLVEIGNALDQIHATAVRSLSETRTLVHALGEDTVVTGVAPGLADIRELVNNACQAGQRARVIIAREVDLLDIGIPAQTAMYRCVQECLTNALRHAPGTILRGSLEVQDLSLVWHAVNHTDALTIAEGSGVAAMRQRLAAVNGSLDVGLADGEFVLEARIPLKEER